MGILSGGTEFVFKVGVVGSKMARVTKPANMAARAWTCPHCQSEQTHELVCQTCERARYASWAIATAEHITEHLTDGLATPLEVLTAMQARPCYQSAQLSLAFIAQQMRLLTKDTTTLARQIAKARASRTMLSVLEHGDTKDQIAVLKGIQVLGDVVEHKGEVVTRHVVELHEGAPPKREG